MACTVAWRNGLWADSVGMTLDVDGETGAAYEMAK